MNRQETLNTIYRELFRAGYVYSKREFAEKIDYNYSVLSSAFNGAERYLTDNLFSSICRAFPGIVNQDFVFKGEGEPLIVEEESTPSYNELSPLNLSTIQDMLDSLIREKSIQFDIIKNAQGQIAAAQDRLRDITEMETKLRIMMQDQLQFTKTVVPVSPSPVPAPAGENSTRKANGRLERLRFSMLDIEPGTILVFDPTDFEVTVVSDREVKYRGKKYTLSGFAKKFMPDDMRNPSDSYQGSKYFSLNGETLDSLRKKKEESK